MLQAKKDLKKKDIELQKIKQQKKNLIKKIDAITIENEELRTVIYEIEMKVQMRVNLRAKNNTI